MATPSMKYQMTRSPMFGYVGDISQQRRDIRPQPSRGATRTQAVFEDISKKVDKFVDGMRFDNWAPRSARAWGKGEYLNLSKEAPKKSSDDMGLLSEGMLKQLQEEEAAKKAGNTREDAMARAFMERASELEGDGEGGGVAAATRKASSYDVKSRAEELNAAGYFDPANKEEFELTGETLAILCYNKYGFFHDMAIKQVLMNKGLNRWVALNLYFGYVGLRGFPYTDEEYVEKLDAVAQIINALEQVDFVYDFFYEKIFPRRGLPSRPRQDTAVSLRLNQSPTWDTQRAEDLSIFM
mmetsp:Transcript_7850/g.14904  ORF Transcript_7850/g.14904 Transcript_7850/m.14904 type:complete len:296 (+) Transcript_7850:110-997(+)